MSKKLCNMLDVKNTVRKINQRRCRGVYLCQIRQLGAKFIEKKYLNKDNKRGEGVSHVYIWRRAFPTEGRANANT